MPQSQKRECTHGCRNSAAAISDDFGPHTDQFREAAISKRGHETMIKASKLLAYTAVDLFVDEALYNKAKQDYEYKKTLP